MREILITSTGIGNINSVVNYFVKQGFTVSFEDFSNLSAVKEDHRPIIIAGVAALYDSRKISDLKERLSDLMSTSRKFVGICAGYQIAFGQLSEAKNAIGLKLDARPVEFVHKGGKSSIGMKRIFDSNHAELGSAYFCHSYGIEFDETKSSDIAYYNAGEKKILSVFMKNNFLGMQFHPEKSPRYSTTLLRDFLTCE